MERGGGGGVFDVAVLRFRPEQLFGATLTRNKLVDPS